MKIVNSKVRDGMKPCSRCKEVKAISEFYIHAKGSRYFSECKTCNKASRKRYYLRNREVILKKDKEKPYTEEKRLYLAEYRKNNSERIKKSKAAWYKKNIEYVTQKRKENYNRNKSDYIRRARVYTLARRSGKNMRHEKYDRMDIYNKFFGYCYMCITKIDLTLKWPDRYSFTIHHIHPVSKGGDDTLDNIAPAHLTCNIRWGNTIRYKDIIERGSIFYKMGVRGEGIYGHL